MGALAGGNDGSTFEGALAIGNLTTQLNGSLLPNYAEPCRTMPNGTNPGLNVTKAAVGSEDHHHNHHYVRVWARPHCYRYKGLMGKRDTERKGCSREPN